MNSYTEMSGVPFLYKKTLFATYCRICVNLPENNLLLKKAFALKTPRREAKLKKNCSVACAESVLSYLKTTLYFEHVQQSYNIVSTAV